MRNRGSIILIDNKKVALIKRIREESTYYVFPGGGIEKGETPESAAAREAFEELGLKVRLRERIATIEWHGTQYFYLAETVSGIFGTGRGAEYSNKSKVNGLYVPLWVSTDELAYLDVRPREVALKIQLLCN